MRYNGFELDMPELASDDLVGQWHIVQTTFPMWLKPAHENPTLNYARISGADASVLEDRVMYRRKGKPKLIRGIDRQHPTRSFEFIWRGRGLLALLTSTWRVIDLDRAGGVMAILFEPTWFTPSGIDVATRAADPDPAVVEACVARIATATILRPLFDQLVALDRG